MDRIDIFRTASTLMNFHGMDAAIQAGMHHDACLEKGDPDGCVVWKQVLKAILELERMQPGEGEGVH